MVETRRSSSSSKRPLSSPSSSPLPNGKISKAAEATSLTNDTACAPAAETLGQATELGCESRDQEVRSSEPSLKPIEGCAATVAEKSPDVQAGGEPFVSPVTFGDSSIDVEKMRSNGGLNRAKRRQLKSNVAIAWGKLLSQCSQVDFRGGPYDDV